MEVQIIAEHQLNKLGNNYLRNEDRRLIFSDWDCDKKYVSLTIDNIEGEIFISREDLEKVFYFFLRNKVH